jgi:hypothetical protein
MVNVNIMVNLSSAKMSAGSVKTVQISLPLDATAMTTSDGNWIQSKPKHKGSLDLENFCSVGIRKSADELSSQYEPENEETNAVACGRSWPCWSCRVLLLGLLSSGHRPSRAHPSLDQRTGSQWPTSCEGKPIANRPNSKRWIRPGIPENITRPTPNFHTSHYCCW